MAYSCTLRCAHLFVNLNLLFDQQLLTNNNNTFQNRPTDENGEASNAPVRITHIDSAVSGEHARVELDPDTGVD